MYIFQDIKGLVYPVKISTKKKDIEINQEEEIYQDINISSIRNINLTHSILYNHQRKNNDMNELLYYTPIYFIKIWLYKSI